MNTKYTDAIAIQVAEQKACREAMLKDAREHEDKARQLRCQARSYREAIDHDGHERVLGEAIAQDLTASRIRLQARPFRLHAIAIRLGVNPDSVMSLSLRGDRLLREKNARD